MRIFGIYSSEKIEIEKVEKNGGKIFAYATTSPFYPDGKGGQLGDRGSIGEANVLSVRENDEYTVLEIDRDIQPGEYVVSIDRQRRMDIAQQHTAQHLLSSALIEIADIETVSFHMGEEYSTIDMDIEFIESNMLNEAEILTNKMVQSALVVEEIVTDLEGSSRYPLRKPLSEKVKGNVRLIKIGQFDVSACSGFHTENTGEIGMIKIIDTEKIKGNLTRLYFVAGLRALKYFQKYNTVLKELSRTLTTSVDELQTRISKMQHQIREQSAALSSISEELARCISTNLEKEGLVYREGYTEVGNFLMKTLDLSNKMLIFFDGTRYLIASQKYDVRLILKQLIESYGGKGGGKREFANYQPEREISRNEFEKLFVKIY
ncbi:MAG TPA: alanyl-tRNA editing protein [Fervidobacterium sp.]|nr:alanyl-tRNA editing protein [Fervidobacterium sp.]HOM73642.1 alanyl-tRNA editing protein [Fervidobacterium sp.]HPP17311.1 alanyl-tRNA editing protein [Fervidobacterium sp.]